MKTLKTIAAYLSSAMLFASLSSAAILVAESNRSHAAAGNFGCTVSGATNATPIVITCAAAHGLADGDQIQIVSVGGNTAANTLGYAKVTSFSTTTFGLFSDAALSAGVAGNGAYTSGGKVSMALDVSGLSATAPFRLDVTINSMTASKNATVCVQDSADGFNADIVTHYCVEISGQVLAIAPQTFSLPKYMLPALRIGVASARLRLNVQWIDASASVATGLDISQ